jgi:hypothetical protein
MGSGGTAGIMMTIPTSGGSGIAVFSYNAIRLQAGSSLNSTVVFNFDEYRIGWTFTDVIPSP